MRSPEKFQCSMCELVASPSAWQVGPRHGQEWLTCRSGRIAKEPVWLPPQNWKWGAKKSTRRSKRNNTEDDGTLSTPKSKRSWGLNIKTIYQYLKTFTFSALPAPHLFVSARFFH